MSEMNVHKTPPSPGFIQPDYLESPEFKKLPGDLKDTLTQTLSVNELNARYAHISEAPQLQKPLTGNVSLAEFFKATSKATTEFRQQLSASEKMDQATRRKSNEATALQAQILSSLYEKRKMTIEKAEAQSKEAIEELKKLLEEMKGQTSGLQDLIDKINAGNEWEKQKNKELVQAYEKYINNLKSIGAIDLGNGKYSIPEGAEEKFKAFTAEYQASVQDYNNYKSERLKEINQYNAAADKYNQTAAANNKKIADFIDKYQLSDYMKAKGLSIPNQSKAPLRDVSDYAKPIEAPSKIIQAPAIIDTFPLPPYVNTIALSGPPTLSKPQNYPAPDPQDFYDGVYKAIKPDTSDIDEAIQTAVAYWAFLRSQTAFNPVQDATPDPLLNTKKLIVKLTPPVVFDASEPAKSERTNGSESAAQAVGLENPQLKEILGRTLLKQTIQNLSLKVNEDQIEAVVDRLLVLSVGLLGNTSLQSLFPAFGLISHSLTSLPKDSPAYALLFSVSLSNRLQEDAKQGLTREALEIVLGDFPELAAMPAEDKAKLEAALNLGLLLIAGKMLEENLGLTGFLAQTLPPLLPSLDSKVLLTQVAQEDQQNALKLQKGIENHALAQGYSPKEAQFLAKVGTELLDQGLLAPAVTSVSAETINQSLLLNSIKANLLLASPFPFEVTDNSQRLAKVDEVAQTAVNQTLKGGPYQSSNQFRTALESNLKDLGVREQTNNIVLGTVIIPAREHALIPKTLIPPPMTAAPSAEAPIAAGITPTPPPAAPPVEQRFTPALLADIMQKRALQVLAPQLGPELAKQISEEIAITWFGTPHPDSRDIGEVKSPYSLINTVKNQLDQFHVEQNKEYFEAVVNTFKETMKTTVEFHAFAIKAMSPAYLFVYSTNAGIMYAGNEPTNWRSAIGLPI